MPSITSRVTGSDREAMLDLVRYYKVDVARNTAEKTPEGYRIHAQANGNQIRRLRAVGYGVEQLEDATQGGKARQKELREVMRKTTLSGEDLAMGRSPHYLSVADVERALAVAASTPNKPFVQLIKLPNKTWENRACHAVRVGKGIRRQSSGHLFPRRRPCPRVGKPGYSGQLPGPAYLGLPQQGRHHYRP